jgi:transcriptional regulator with XRE-family HTH domain
VTQNGEVSDSTGSTRRRRAIPVRPAAATVHGLRKRRAGAEDIEIGRKIRALRLERGLSQSNLADGIGLTFQQVQKYEKGTNRVSAGRLQRIADMLNIPVMFFYGGMSARPTAKKRETGDPDFSFMQTRGAVRIMRAYSQIGSRSTKYALVVLVESLRDKDKASRP